MNSARSSTEAERAPHPNLTRPDVGLTWGIRVVFRALPPAARRVLAGKPVHRDGQTLDPDLQLLLRLGKLTARRAPVPTLQSRRQQLEVGGPLVGGDVAAGVTTREIDLTADDPGRNLPSRLYTPDGLSAGSPLLVYFHGGAWVTGSLNSHDPLCRFLAAHAGVRVLSFGYRRAPEHPFPAAVDDAVAAFAYARAHASDLGADLDAIAVGGDSAGGGLAAVVAHLAVRAGRPAPAFLLMFYPHCDTANRSVSRELFGNRFGLTDADIEWYTDQYLPPGVDRSDPRVSIALADDLSGLPPTYVVTGGFDPLRDEGELLASRLAEAGVDVVLRREPDLIHGFANLLGISVRCREAVAQGAGALRVGLALAVGAHGIPG
jgi:acetyl esterase